MKLPLLLLGTALISGGMISSCTYNTYVPPPPVRNIHHYSTTTATTKSASVGGSSGGSSAEGFQAVTPPHSYSQ